MGEKNSIPPRRQYRPGACWSFFWFVVIVGIILALFHIAVGVGGTVRIPSTNFSISAGISVGRKDFAPQALPSYLRNQIGDNSTVFNQTNTLTLWIAEGMGILVLGYQPQAPSGNITAFLKT